MVGGDVGRLLTPTPIRRRWVCSLARSVRPRVASEPGVEANTNFLLRTCSVRMAPSLHSSLAMDRGFESRGISERETGGGRYNIQQIAVTKSDECIKDMTSSIETKT